jgi:alpha-1,2-mannosyltransferase
LTSRIRQITQIGNPYLRHLRIPYLRYLRIPFGTIYFASVLARVRALAWPVGLLALAAVVYLVRIQHEMVDFDVYRMAGARAIAAEPLYRLEDGHYQFKYFPAFAFVMAPFAWLNRDTAKIVWFALSVALLTAFVRWSVAALPARRRTGRVLVWLTILLMAKFYAHELTLGQTNILLGTLLIGSLVAAQLDRPGLSGAIVGLAVLVKPYALVMVPWLAISGGPRALVTVATVLVTGLLVPTLVYGWTGNLQLISDWYRTVADTTAANVLIAENVSLGTMWAKWIGAGEVAWWLALMTGAAAVALVIAGWTKRRQVEAPEYLEFGQLMLLVPLLSPQGWDYVLLLATPAVICLVDRLTEMAKPWRAVTVVALALMSFTIYDLLGRSLYHWFMAISIVSVSALALGASLAYLRIRALA